MERLTQLATLNEVFSGIDDLLISNMDEFRSWYDGETPGSDAFPCDYSTKLTQFQSYWLFVASAQTELIMRLHYSLQTVWARNMSNHQF